MCIFGKKIAMMQEPERHPLSPFLPENARVLHLGSFPPPKDKWKMDFYYPNFQNDMWRIFGIAFFDDKDYFLSADKKSFEQGRIEGFLNRKGIALSDTGREVVRQKGNASDNFLEIVAPIDLNVALRRIPACEIIATTGEKATETLRLLFAGETPKPPAGGFVNVLFGQRELKFFRLPSSSRAYPKPLSDKAAVYKRFFREVGLL
jgi:G:T/U-mismatch repair DNA glycosylase